MLTTGQTLTPQKAKAMGLIHEIAAPDKLIEAAKAMIKDGLKPVAALGREGLQAARRPGLFGRRAPISGRRPSPSCAARPTAIIPAAAAILKCVYEGLLVPFDTGAAGSSSATSPRSCRRRKRR